MTVGGGSDVLQVILLLEASKGIFFSTDAEVALL